MNEFLQQLIQQFKDTWEKFSRTQKTVIITIPVVVFIGLMALIINASHTQYAVLYSGLGDKDAADVITELKKENIPYQVTGKDNLTAILVPTDKVYDTRLTLAGEGLPKGNGVGFEIFDQPKWGSTDFTQQVNYKRALQGELERTIDSLEEIQSCRVNIVIPQPQLFTENEVPTTASVVLILKPNATLDRDRVRGIVHLVAASVEGLKPENVNVVDDSGNILSGFISQEEAENGSDNSDTTNGIDSDTLTQQAKLTLHDLQVQQSYENDLQNKITTMLNKVLGGNSRFAVSVSAQLNFNQTENDSETFEPVVDGQGIVRSQQTNREQYVGDGSLPNTIVGGVPGTDTNIPGYQASLATGTNSQYSKEQTTTNYEIDRTVEHQNVAPGTPVRISVGVFVDNLQPQQVQAIQSAVIAAAGLDMSRGDQVAVENMPFDNTQALDSLKETQMETQQTLYMTLGKIGLLVLMAFGILLFLRSILKPKREKQFVDEVEMEEPPMPQVEDLISNDMTAEDLGRAESAMNAKRREAIRKEVMEMANRNPENIAQIIKKWLSEE